ncbi:ABC transporter substrate-binding protein [Paenibacillus yanchengensis]|uniref:ABC transporter substrate-binding protein n=1 Tax=Paenibacillus yanchengensis TaxID=2035833 RepID=A0ABW4YGR1_9BACL
MVKKGWLKSWIAIVLVASLLAGCSLGGGDTKPSKESGTLKVVYYDENSFHQQYGSLFSVLHPDVEFEIVSTNKLFNNQQDENFDYEKAYEEFIKTEKPDVIITHSSEMKQLIDKGLLLDLESMLTKSKVNTEELVPGVLDYMKELGEGVLYGLPTSFRSSVLLYNKALFDQFNIEHPTDQMTWQEVFQLAQRFPTDGDASERIYGLSLGWSSDFRSVLNNLMMAEQLKFYDAEAKTMTINTPAWKSLIETALAFVKSNSLYVIDEEQMNGSYSYTSYEDHLMQREPFLANRVAMTIGETYTIDEIKRARDSVQDQSKIISDWDMVTVPVSPQAPDESSSMYFNNVFSITAESTNKDLAWKFVSYVTGEEFSRVKSKGGLYGEFPIHTKYIKDDEGRNYAAFYKLKPVVNHDEMNMMMGSDDLPKQFYFLYDQEMQKKLAEIEKDESTIDAALEYLQTKGEELLLQESMTDEELQKMYEQTYGGGASEGTVIVE